MMVVQGFLCMSTGCLGGQNKPAVFYLSPQEAIPFLVSCREVILFVNNLLCFFFFPSSYMLRTTFSFLFQKPGAQIYQLSLD